MATLREHVLAFPLQPPLMGNILLDLSPFVVLGSKQIPMSGRTTWPGNFSLFPGLLQGLTVDSISIPSITYGRTTLVVR